MRNLRGHQYSCSFAGERQDVPFLFDTVPGPVSKRSRPVKAFGCLVGISRPSAKLQEMARKECGPLTLEVSGLTNSPFRSEERIDLW